MPERTNWLMGAIKLIGRLPPVSLPEHDPKDLPDIEEKESPLPPGSGSIPTARITNEGAGATAEGEQQHPPPKHRKPNPTSPGVSTSTVGSYPDLMEDSHATSRGQGSSSPLRQGLQDNIHCMLPYNQARALHLLQQMGPATGSLAPIPYQPPFSSTREAAILTAQIPIDVLAAAASAAVVRTQQVT